VCFLDSSYTIGTSHKTKTATGINNAGKTIYLFLKTSKEIPITLATSTTLEIAIPPIIKGKTIIFSTPKLKPIHQYQHQR
jgi:hypothetical protein